jgi:hypothetical protein
MQVAMKIKHVIIDGSNIATEGRDAPSLAQLDEAVQAFIEEYSPDFVTVVVDATFPNRIDRKERQIYEDAVNANELITPPAGAIGRGDAFILQIARRADAAILSNDSFQEFHGEYPWLFEKGRLIGGKPVPHVGWVFMDRAPVRGPTSRRAVSEARKVAKAAVKSNARAKTATETSDGDAPARTRRSRTKAKAAAPAATAEGADDRDGRESSDGDDSDGRGPRGGRGSSDSRSGRGRRAQPADAAEAPEASADGRSTGSGRAPKGVEPYNEALPFIEFVARHPVGSEVDAVIERFSSHGAYVLVGTARAYVPLGNMGDPAPRSAKEVLRVGDDRRFVVVSIDPPRRGIDLAVPGVVAVPVTAPPDLDVVAAAARSTTDAAAPEGAEAGESPEDETSEPGAAAPRKATARKSAAKKAAKATGARKAATRKAATRKADAPAADGDAPADAAAAAGSVTEAHADRAAEPSTATGSPDEGDVASTTAPAGSPTAKKARAKKAPARKAAPKKAPAKKAAAKKTTAKKAATRKAPAKAASKATKKTAAKSSATAPAAGDATAAVDAER